MKHNIKAFVLDSKGATFFTVSGERIIIRQGDVRLRKLIEEATPAIERKEVIELDFSIEEVPNPYDTFSKKTNGLVKFFRVAKQKVTNWLSARSDNEDANDCAEKRPSESAVAAVTKTAETAAARLQEVMDHAKPYDSKQLSKEISGTSETPVDQLTTVAVVGDTVIPDVEVLDKHMTMALETGHSVGLEALYKRLAGLIRGHHVTELLNFLKRGDLPIANDGRIVIYKVLKTKEGLENGCTMVDCHSGTVPQRPGAIVRMDESAVNPSRRHACSTGLHVARRGYLRSFSGDAMTLAIVAPEHIIAVPEGEPDKMRVSQYEILAELSKEEAKNLRDGKGLQTPEGLELLRRALAGEFPPATLDVYIGKADKDKPEVVMTVLGQPQEHAQEQLVVADDVVQTNEPDEQPEPQVEEPAPYVEPKVLSETPVKAVDTTVAKDEPVNVQDLVSGNTRAKKAQDMLDDYNRSANRAEKEMNARTLHAYKQATKKSWEFLGISPADVEKIMHWVK